MPFDLTPTLIWAIIGIVIIVVEMMTGTFFILFFGVGALAVSLLKKFTGLDSLAYEIIIFAIIGTTGIIIFRKKLLQSLSPEKTYSNDEDKIIFLTETVPAKKMANVQYQGTQWQAYNDSDQNLEKGSQALIIRVDGVKLILKPVE